MVMVETTRGVMTRVCSLPVILTSLDSKNETSFYLNLRQHVNHYYEVLVKVLLNGGVSARTPKRAREATCAPQKPVLPQTA